MKVTATSKTLSFSSKKDDNRRSGAFKEPSGKKGSESGKVFSKVLENCLEGKVDVRG